MSQNDVENKLIIVGTSIDKVFTDKKSSKESIEQLKHVDIINKSPKNESILAKLIHNFRENIPIDTNINLSKDLWWLNEQEQNNQEEEEIIDEQQEQEQGEKIDQKDHIESESFDNDINEAIEIYAADKKVEELSNSSIDDGDSTTTTNSIISNITTATSSSNGLNDSALYIASTIDIKEELDEQQQQHDDDDDDDKEQEKLILQQQDNILRLATEVHQEGHHNKLIKLQQKLFKNFDSNDLILESLISNDEVDDLLSDWKHQHKDLLKAQQDSNILDDFNIDELLDGLDTIINDQLHDIQKEEEEEEEEEELQDNQLKSQEEEKVMKEEMPVEAVAEKIEVMNTNEINEKIKKIEQEKEEDEEEEEKKHQEIENKIAQDDVLLVKKSAAKQIKCDVATNTEQVTEHIPFKSKNKQNKSIQVQPILYKKSNKLKSIKQQAQNKEEEEEELEQYNKQEKVVSPPQQKESHHSTKKKKKKKIQC